MDTIDFACFPFDSEYAAFLHSCVHIEPTDAIPDSSYFNPSTLLQSSLSVDLVQIDSLPDSPLISNDKLLALTLADISPAHRALHALDLHLCQTQSSWSQFYATLSDNMEHALCGHMDGGAQASTTNCLEYLFHYQLLGESSTTLKVADDTPHYLVDLGFLRVTADMDLGYVMVPTFYTPTLLATIISPSDLGSKMGCASFTTFASLTDKDCSITLHHCCWRSQDICIPLTVVWGLLYTAALHRPTDSDCTSLPPSPSLHVHVVGYSSGRII